MSDPNWLINKATIEERPFISNTPIIGGAIVRVRELWNSVSTKWYIRPLLNQQNRFNQIVAAQLQEHDIWHISHDQQQTELARQLAELTVELVQINKRLSHLEEKASSQSSPNS